MTGSQARKRKRKKRRNSRGKRKRRKKENQKRRKRRGKKGSKSSSGGGLNIGAGDSIGRDSHLQTEIPEFSDVGIPIIAVVALFVVFRRKRKRIGKIN
ncbi:MAG: PEF-CTERM sorting domain-containing protein [Thermoplasmata archaeon]|nr:PEF-CTERM sorting domain-containing protein [Thermoplasmata archaeon]